MIPANWRLDVRDTLESTQTTLVSLAETGAADRTALLAARQTQGRGRGGRAWESPVGNLYLSVLLRPEGVPRDAPQWSLLAAVALAEAAASVDPEPAAIAVKWPNDLLRGGAKVAGIIAESTVTNGRLAWLVLGFGVNLDHAPVLSDGRRAAMLPNAGPPSRFAAALLAQLDRWRAVAEQEGFAPIRAAWQLRGPAPGAPLLVRTGTQHVRGRFAGLADDGSLRLDTDGGTLRIATGEVALAPEG